jgi:hypothetical protein
LRVTSEGGIPTDKILCYAQKAEMSARNSIRRWQFNIEVLFRILNALGGRSLGGRFDPWGDLGSRWVSRLPEPKLTHRRIKLLFTLVANFLGTFSPD